MTLRNVSSWLQVALVAGLLNWFAAPFAQAQSGDNPSADNGLQLPGQLGVTGFGGETEQPKVQVTAQIDAQNGGPAGRISVTAKIPKNWHIYSITQKKGGPIPTKLTLQADPAVKLDGTFKPDKPPKTHKDEIYDGLEVEEHFDAVTWQAKVELPAGVDPSSFEVKLKFTGQICSEQNCIPFSQTVKVKLEGFAPGKTKAGAAGKTSSTEPPSGAAPATATSAATPPAATPPTTSPATEKPFLPGPYRERLSHANWTGKVRWDFAKKPGVYELELTAQVADHWHVYAYSPKPPAKAVAGMPTILGLVDRERWTLETPRASSEPVTKSVAGVEQVFHEGDVTWTAQVKSNSTAEGGDFRGLIGFQTCEKSCDPPAGAEFGVTLPDPRATPSGELALGFRKASYNAAKAAAEGKSSAPPKAAATAQDSPSTTAPSAAAGVTPPARNWQVRKLTGSADLTLWSALGLAFCGGLLLNFMPCVLPVIGLKLVAFVQQSQGSRKQIFLLNLFYSLGLIAVFLVLGILAAAPQWFGSDEKLKWASQFQSATFSLVMACAVFVFALSMLGLWEIPMPGMVGSGKTAELANQQGYGGAFAKGAFTTIMATPCTGPFMGSALTWSLSQSTTIALSTFFALGLGMASPYLLIGAFPKLMKFVPKPGAWMDTFKQTMGFLLLATVVYFFSFIPKDLVVPSIGLLVGLGMGCWWIGRTPIYAELGEKLRAWGLGAAMAGAVGWLSFAAFGPTKELLEWKDFSRAEFEQLLQEGHTVMIDFTADWCPNCKVNERIAYNVPKTQAMVEENQVIVIKADKTALDERSEAIDQLLNELGNELGQIPYLAIFPGDGSDPLVLDGPVTPGLVLDALRQAGPSRAKGGEKVVTRE